MLTPKLIVLRGPSGSGKSSVAKKLREYLTEPTALIEQDYFRRIVLKEKDIPHGKNIDLIRTTVLFCLEKKYTVILEGIFDTRRYETMFQEIIKKRPHKNYFFYFDISFEETLRRHQTKSNSHEFGEKEMRSWYKEKDFLTCAQETLIPESNSFKETLTQIKKTSNY